MKSNGEQVIIKIMGKLLQWLEEIDPTSYHSFCVIEQSKRVLYLKIIWAIYVILEVSLLWCSEFNSDLQNLGFKSNASDHCAANIKVNKNQNIIRIHVNDVLSYNVDPRINYDFDKRVNHKYGKLNLVETHRGKVHKIPGLTLDFPIKSKCHFLQKKHIIDVFSTWPESFDKDTVFTPFSNDLFERVGGRLLGNNKI